MSVVDPDADLSELYDMPKSAAGVEKVFVLDGQQRLQTLHSIFRGGVHDDGGAVAEAYCDLTQGDQPILGSELLYGLTFSPIRLDLPMFRVRDLVERFSTGNAMEIADDLNDQLEALLPLPPDSRRQREHRVRVTIQQLDSILNHDKHFWVDELDGVAKIYPYRRVLEIFVRVNSGGTKLTAGDLMFAAMKEGWEDVEQRVEQTIDLLNGGRLSIDQDFVLKCLLLAHGKGAEVKTEKFYGPEGEAFLKTIESNWDQAERAFLQLRDFMVHSVRALSDKLIRSYNALIPLFDFLYHNPQPTEAQRQRMAAYYHKAQLFGWYSYQTDVVLNSLHQIAGHPLGGHFPLEEIKQYFANRGMAVTLGPSHLQDRRLRGMLLNIVYSDRWGLSPFDVAFKGNEPHVDHIYPQHMLRTRLGCANTEINDIGNLRFVGATDNIRKRAELPDSYFGRLKASGVPIEKHLLLKEFADKPETLAFSRDVFDGFREQRRNEVSVSVKRAVDPEAPAEPAFTTSESRQAT